MTIEASKADGMSLYPETLTEILTVGEPYRKIQLFLKSSQSNTASKKMKMGDRKPKDMTQPQYLKVAVYKTNVDTMQD